MMKKDKLVSLVFPNFLKKILIKKKNLQHQKQNQKKIVRLQRIDSNYFCGKNHVKDDGMQNYLVFQPVYRYFRNIANNNISPWKSKGFSEVLNLLLHP